MKSGESLLDRYHSSKTDDGIQIMKNRPPRWSEAVGAYVLNFNGRVTMASVKNFQLVNPAKVCQCMQFDCAGYRHARRGVMVCDSVEWRGCVDAIREGRKGQIYSRLPVSALCVPGLRNCVEQF